ncbi:g134 [Coccomyxa viridis]|uniref:G134 protein n=1 Tax=Coccomyxa viridis TaxID=1274662 RepID=A0ABP1FEZ5_9CHLO
MEQCFDWLEKTVREFDERMDLRIKTFYGPDSAVAMQAKQALQTRSREHALAHIGIPSSFGAFINQGIADLAEDWVHTYQTVLTEQQRQEIRNHFGKGLVSFFNTDLTEYAPEAKDNAEAPEWSFCYEEKAYLMIIIDSTQDIAEREGLRAAYEILCHSDSQNGVVGGGAATSLANCKQQ